MVPIYVWVIFRMLQKLNVCQNQWIMKYNFIEMVLATCMHIMHALDIPFQNNLEVFMYYFITQGVYYLVLVIVYSHLAWNMWHLNGTWRCLWEIWTCTFPRSWGWKWPFKYICLGSMDPETKLSNLWLVKLCSVFIIKRWTNICFSKRWTEICFFQRYGLTFDFRANETKFTIV